MTRPSEDRAQASPIKQFFRVDADAVVAWQACEEVREDRHPIVFIVGQDISEILIANGFNTVERVSNLLQNEFRVG